jgi:hypothetical protein
MFAMTIGTTISCSLDRQYGPVLSLSFFDIYGESPSVKHRHIILSGLFMRSKQGDIYSKNLQYGALATNHFGGKMFEL